MASVKFYLTRANAKEKTAVFFLCNFGAFEMVDGKKKYLPLKYYTDESIDPDFWNPEKGRAKETKKFPQYPEFNARLQNIEDTTLNVLRRLKNDGVVPTKESLKAELDKIWKTTKDMSVSVHPQTMEFFTFIEHFINTATRKPSTKSTYRLVLDNLKDYADEKDVVLTFSTIDIDFYNSFVAFLKARDNSPNTIGTRIKVLKTFLSNAFERGLPVNNDYRRRSFSKPHEETDAVYLNEAELLKVYQLDLIENPKLERTRDLFIIGCYTGLRFSDLSMLSKENISAANTISIKTVKTSADVVIPIHPMVRAILEKYNYILPKVPSNQLFNNNIKEVAKLAGITEPIYLERTKGDKREKKSIPKYELTTSHTARRSFATNAYLRDVPSISIMRITGHKTESSFMKYIKISQKDNAMKLQMHSFFTQPLQ